MAAPVAASAGLSERYKRRGAAGGVASADTPKRVCSRSVMKLNRPPSLDREALW